MKAAKLILVNWLIVWVVLWPFGRTMAQPKVDEGLQTVQRLKNTGDRPDVRSQQVSFHETPPPPLPEAGHITHIIKWEGENLGWIALWYTGSSKNWIHLDEANPWIKPREIAIGDSVLIPKELIKTDQPMTIEFLSSAIDKKKESSPPFAPKPGNSDILELYGPLDTGSEPSGVNDVHAPLPLETIE